jgi:holo-[acyl-carrier protein] synthase
MIYGIGTDICQIGRIADALVRNGDRFAERVLGPDEMQTYHARKAASPVRAQRFLATRFAAKEAFGKAIGLGVAMPMTLHNAQLLNEESGKPVMVCSGTLAEFMQQNRLSSHVTVSDEADYAVAFVIVEQAPPTE